MTVADGDTAARSGAMRREIRERLLLILEAVLVVGAIASTVSVAALALYFLVLFL